MQVARKNLEGTPTEKSRRPALMAIVDGAPIKKSVI
jgi:hypothetical protein